MSVDPTPAGWRRLLPVQNKNPRQPQPTVSVIDPISGGVSVVQEFPTVLIDGVAITLVDGTPALDITRGDTRVNGVPFRGEASIPDGDTVALATGGGLRAVHPGPHTEAINTEHWIVFDTRSGAIIGETRPEGITSLVARTGHAAEHFAACPRGLQSGFAVADIRDALDSGYKNTGGDVARNNGDSGEHFCPACWLRFDSGDALNIATHEDLVGDPVLGPEKRLRFQPTRFNDAGIALDPMGLPSPDLACPHCRRRLPQNFLETSHNIFSVVGAPGAGKSYLLAVLTKLMQDNLYRDLGLTFRDDDPTGNLMLNQMRSRLFSALSPEDAILSKTALEGAFYEHTLRHGRTVAMPRPFVYSIRNHRSKDTSLVFYDNAGEHFEPGLDHESSPGAMHVARSAGVFFLFDPTANARFRAELEGHSDDPQLSQAGRIDRQDTILSEMDVRIKRVLGIPREQRIDTPIAVLVGKSDVWADMFNADRLPSPVTADKRLSIERVDANSDYLRSLLLDLCPGLVSGAESISNNVRYFAVTALGHSPTAIKEGPRAGMLAPDPKKLKPGSIDHAAYWLISKSVPGIIPTE